MYYMSKQARRRKALRGLTDKELYAITTLQPGSYGILKTRTGKATMSGR